MNYHPENARETPLLGQLEQRTPKRPTKIPQASFILALKKKIYVSPQKGHITVKWNDKRQFLEDLKKTVRVHQFSQVKQLNLIFREVTDDGMQIFVSTLARYFTQLELLHLKLTGDIGATDKGIEILMPGIARHLTHLRQFSLNLGGCVKITNKGVEIVISQLKTHLSQLRYLSLVFFSSAKITDLSPMLLGSKIGRSLTYLEHLSISFDQCEEITDTGLLALGSEISRHITRLKHLEVIFSQCIRITDEGLKAFSTQISSQFIKLSSLYLNFSKCRKLTDYGIGILVSEIAKLDQLKQLTLLFNGCPKLTHKTLEVLSSNITINHIHLKKLHLSVKECLIAEDKVELFVTQIASQNHFPQLQHLTLEFLCLKEAFKGKIQRLLTFIPKVPPLDSLRRDRAVTLV